MAKALEVTPDLSLIKDLVSETWYAKLIASSSGADLSPADEFGIQPIRETFEINPNFSQNTKETETGRESVTSVKQKWELKVTTGQISLTTLYTLPNAMLNQTILFVLELNEEPIGGKHLIAAVLGQLFQLPSIKAKGSIEYVLSLLPATDDIDISLTTAVFDKFKGNLTTPVTLTIPDGKYLGMVEVDAA